MKPVLLTDKAPNSAQRYITHGIFRYFGKYPPTSTRLLLEELWKRGATGSVVDIMCGSGTTLLEALLNGHDAIGMDVNPISVLISQVKIERADNSKAIRLLTWLSNYSFRLLSQPLPMNGLKANARVKKDSGPPRSKVQEIQDAAMSKVGRWFNRSASIQHALVRAWVDVVPNSPEKRAVTLGWLKTIRATSRASNRTGRLFLDKQKQPPAPWDVLAKKVIEIVKMQSRLPDSLPRCDVIQASAMKIPAYIEPLQTIFWHPPYFALYKYSSDVLRLELEWCGINRKKLVTEELRDGFKTSNPADAEKYLEDCGKVWHKLYTVSSPGALGVAINSDSTLAQKKLNIFNQFAQLAVDSGFQIEEIYRRPTKQTQASYHRSAHKEIQTKEDFIMVFKKPC